jgi:hypothetical protein
MGDRMKTLPELQSMSDAELNALAAEFLGFVIKITGVINPNGLILIRGPFTDAELASVVPPTCSSRDLAFELRKDFTVEEHRNYRYKLLIMTACQSEGMPENIDAHYKAYDNASARQQTISAVMVLQERKGKG